MHEPELHLREDILVPDVAGWRRERLPRIQETWDEVIAPDWVCETMADSTRELDLNGKRPVYAREGIPHLWLVEPTDRTLDAFEVQEGQWVLIASVKDDDPVSIGPFDAITGNAPGSSPGSIKLGARNMQMGDGLHARNSSSLPRSVRNDHDTDSLVLTESPFRPAPCHPASILRSGRSLARRCSPSRVRTAGPHGPRPSSPVAIRTPRADAAAPHPRSPGLGIPPSHWDRRSNRTAVQGSGRFWARE